MRLEDIGFYTLSDSRARHTSLHSPLWRCELLVTDKCNFKCQYCRGLKSQYQGDIPLDKALLILDYWIAEGLLNVRFSGGEPTLHTDIYQLVFHCQQHGVERIAISTNGSADFEVYTKLIECGVNDFSISLDSCCSSGCASMNGNVWGYWKRIIENIKKLSVLTYVTTGIVVDERNLQTCLKTINLSADLGVSDIRVIPSAQYNQLLQNISGLEDGLLAEYPILRYRINNIRGERSVRGLQKGDCPVCRLVLDDMAVVQGYHFPCIIYLREGGDPIGRVNPNTRQERYQWMQKHNSFQDPICRDNCLDVCIDYNNKANEAIQ